MLYDLAHLESPIVNSEEGHGFDSHWGLGKLFFRVFPLELVRCCVIDTIVISTKLPEKRRYFNRFLNLLPVFGLQEL